MEFPRGPRALYDIILLSLDSEPDIRSAHRIMSNIDNDAKARFGFAKRRFSMLK